MPASGLHQAYNPHPASSPITTHHFIHSHLAQTPLMDFTFPLFALKKLLAALLLPPLLPLWPLLLGLLLLQRRPRCARILCWSGLVFSLLLMTPASVGWLLRLSEDPQPLASSELERAQAIVILGAGRRSYAPEYGGETVNRLALERLRYGAWLARQSGLPVLLTGGAPEGRVAEATLMQQVLTDEFAVPVHWTETASLDTRGNARLSAPILHEAGVKRILLVTHAAHMRRARAEFETAGFEVIPAPTGWLGQYDPTSGPSLPSQQLPNAGSAYAAWFAVHELLGELAYRFSRD